MTDRDDALTSLFGEGPQNSFYLPDHAPVLCLVFLLFLVSDNEEKLVKDAQSLIYNEKESYLELLHKSLEADEAGFKCYLQAVDALDQGEIEEYIPDPAPSPYPPEIGTRRVYSISFLEWAENAGYTIPKFILDNLRNKAFHYYDRKQWREQEKIDFPALTSVDLTQLSKEPLWPLHRAVLYAMGYKTSKKLDAIANFLQYKKMAKQLFSYIKDAQKAGDLVLINSPVMPDGNSNLLTAEVKPSVFIEWVKTLPLYLPAFTGGEEKKSKDDKELSSRERNTLLKMIIGMAVEQYGYNPEAKKSDATQNIISDLEQCGLGLDANTVRKKLKEASELLPQDYLKGKTE